LRNPEIAARMNRHFSGERRARIGLPDQAKHFGMFQGSAAAEESEVAWGSALSISPITRRGRGLRAAVAGGDGSASEMIGY
jgi:hypothetical protein